MKDASQIPHLSEDFTGPPLLIITFPKFTTPALPTTLKCPQVASGTTYLSIH